jgi:hypothetical protein
VGIISLVCGGIHWAAFARSPRWASRRTLRVIAIRYGVRRHDDALLVVEPD